VEEEDDGWVCTEMKYDLPGEGMTMTGAVYSVYSVYSVHSVYRGDDHDRCSVSHHAPPPSLYSLYSCTLLLLLTAYAQSEFAQVRHLFGVDEESYMLSVGVRQVVGSMLLGDMSGMSTSISEGKTIYIYTVLTIPYTIPYTLSIGMSTSISEGKSGSFFYFTHDGRYMVKTIVADEKNTFCKYIKSYRQDIYYTHYTLHSL
jgi:hypothetical protein